MKRQPFEVAFPMFLTIDWLRRYWKEHVRFSGFHYQIARAMVLQAAFSFFMPMLSR